MKKNYFKAKVIKGKVVLEDVGWFNNCIALFEGMEILIGIQKWYRKRSNPQNDYYWGVIVDMLMQYTGEDDKDDMHEYLKLEHAPDKDFMGKKIKKGTSRMTTQEFEYYMSEIRMWASKELHFYIPDPNEAPIYGYRFSELTKKNKSVK